MAVFVFMGCNKQGDNDVRVTTYTPQDITQTSAVCGGDVIVTQGLSLNELGVCWSTERNPTANDSHLSTTNWSDTYVCTIMGLESNTTYHVRAYALRGLEYYYGDDKVFTTLESNGGDQYTIRVFANPTEGGTVSGDGSFIPGTSCTVTASENSGYSFTNWTENGNVVSTNANYTFMVTGNRTLVAQFTANPPNYMITISANPSNSGIVTGSGTYQQGQSCTVTAIANSGYTFSEWTENGTLVSNDGNYTFIVNSNRVLVAQFTYNSVGGHEYVDLGLPSGQLWATCNVGASIPEEYGDYFAWAETDTKIIYNWSTYKYGEYCELTKYCNNPSYGYNDYTDNLIVLQADDDAATANWGSGWHMPTKTDWEELYQNTTVRWTTQGGVNGRCFTASNGSSLFLPAAGYRYGDGLDDAGSYGYYWSSSLRTENPNCAWSYYFYSVGNSMYGDYRRFYGRSVRAVHSARQN